MALSKCKACLSLTLVPLFSISHKIVFIPKEGETSHTEAKGFKLISLSSFLLKLLEKVIDNYIRSSLGYNSLESLNMPILKESPLKQRFNHWWATKKVLCITGNSLKLHASILREMSTTLNLKQLLTLWDIWKLNQRLSTLSADSWTTGALIPILSPLFWKMNIIELNEC